jgi:hypothetical protein
MINPKMLATLIPTICVIDQCFFVESSDTIKEEGEGDSGEGRGVMG